VVLKRSRDSAASRNHDIQTENKHQNGMINMNKIANLILCLAAVAISAGCAGGPDFKTYSSTLNPPKEGESRVWFYRPSKMLGGLVQPTVYINDIPLAKAQPGCFFYADKTPGSYEIKCVTEWADKAQLTVVENRTDYVRLTLLPGVFVGHILPQVVPEEDGLKQIQACHLITADDMNKNWTPPQK
jgi:hypothetical protein